MERMWMVRAEGYTLEVKHRKAKTGSEDNHSFLGGSHKDDCGLYVSTGGFSADAYKLIALRCR